jgi:nucleotide-binding universal stress UspA family protein
LSGEAVATVDGPGRTRRGNLVRVSDEAESVQLVVAGVDGSPGSVAALRVAAEEARLRNARLRVVMAWQLTWPELAIETPRVLQQVQERARAQLDAALAALDSSDAGLEIDADLVSGHPVTVLIEATEDATMLVVGTRGTSGVVGTVVGSVAHALIHHAHCPVLVVPKHE